MKTKAKRLLTWLMAVMLIAIPALTALPGYAVWDSEKAVHIKPAEIENATLLIGTHLIHLSALNDSIYQISTDSASESGQMAVYYKSELGEDAWFDITSATKLADITTGGTPVSSEVIEALFLTHHTKSDGVTYDLRTGLPVDPRNIKNPYELESMEELFPLKTQYDLLKNTQSNTDDGPKQFDRLTAFFATEVKPDKPKYDYEAEMAAVGEYYTVLKENGGGTPQKNAVQGVMDALDAARRAAVLNIVDAELNSYLDTLANDKTPSGTLQSAAADSMTNVRASLVKQEGKMLSEGSSLTSKVRYRFSRALIQFAVEKNHASCDGEVENIIALDNITNNVVQDAAKELALLDTTLLGEATQMYTQIATAGENAAYTKAVGEQQATVLLRQISKLNLSQVDSHRGELELLITAKTTRQSPAQGVAFIDERLALTNGWYATVPNDFFRSDIHQSLDKHIDFLTQLRRKLELLAGGTDLDALALQKGDLQTQMLSLLDKNDLAGAKKLSDQIAGLDAKLGGEGALGDKISALKQGALDALQNGDLTGLQDGVNALSGLGAGLGAGLAQTALGDLRDAMLREKNLNGMAGLDGALQAAEQGLLGNGSDTGTGTSTGSGTGGTGTGTGGTGTLRSAADLERIATAFFKEKSGELGLVENATTAQAAPAYSGTALTQLVTSGTGSTSYTPANKYSHPVANLLALEMYYRQNGSKEALGLMQTKTTQQRMADNPLVFQKLKDPAGEYLPLPALCLYTTMRYVWNTDRSVGTLARGGTYYGFALGSAEVKRSQDSEKADTMTAAVCYQDNRSYIPEQYAFAQFGAEAVYLSAEGSAVLCDGQLLALAEELYGRFIA